MKKQATCIIIFLLVGLFTNAQAFTGTYAIGKTTFKVAQLTKEDEQAGLYNIVYSKGNKNGTLASATEDPKFEFVFLGHEGDIYLGTFYFTKAWKGKPLEGYYIRASSRKKFRVKFIKE